MSMIKVPLAAGGHVWINPDLVRAVMPHVSDEGPRCQIDFGEEYGNAFTVSMEADAVANEIIAAKRVFWIDLLGRFPAGRT